MLELIREFCKVIGYKIHTQKSIAFVYTNNATVQKELAKQVSFTIATKNSKYIGTNLIKSVKDLYNKKYKTLRKHN